ncbi:hypothetical protein EG68_03651 [Paragonimus skrjabini miyazakii]|uniref:Hexosyltransferase n=1 Tax=Paragonimus skrjabini miyazakii TaxID=59628 RepID=A0A8S9YVY4_9TREM|nr:hypothetical protein EG68_03651 [Paragonimus skrjabini miyazakii]
MKEWLYLGNLSGVGSVKHAVPEQCYFDELENENRPAAHAGRRPFVQSDYLPIPMFINVFQEICRISKGQEPTVTPCTNHDFPLVHSAQGKCLPGQPIDLLILISSDDANYEQRDAIRRYWANSACWLGAKVRHVFLLGSSSDAVVSDPGIAEEQEIYNDIVQQHIATYDENTMASYKLLLGFRWSLAFCAQAKWLLFVTDGQFVNPFNTISFLLSVSEAMRQRLVVGSVWYEPFVNDVKPLWYPTDTQKAEDNERFPTFVATSAVFVSSVLSPSIYFTMRFTQLANHPDLFMAYALRKLFILPAHFDDIYAHTRQPLNAEAYERAIVFPCGGKANQSETWELLKCGKYCQ